MYIHTQVGDVGNQRAILKFWGLVRVISKGYRLEIRQH
jgi:hypothetical protein